MLTKIATNFKQISCENPKANYLLTISGGVDSMVLLHICQELKLDIIVAHCNFKLRNEESDGDEAFVKKYCEINQIPFYSRSFQTEIYAKENKLSIQVAARKLRYDWFYQILENEKFDFIITAHHLDDQIETFFINTIRGTGLDGLKGIPLINNKIFRPFLSLSKEDIVAYAIRNNLKWREDSSNASDKYMRNKIRHHLVPICRELNNSFEKSFQNTLNHLQQSQFIVDKQVRLMYQICVKKLNENNLSINLSKLTQNTENENEIFFYLYNWLKHYGFTEWNDVTHLLSAQTGKKIISSSHQLIKNREELLLYPLKKLTTAPIKINSISGDENFPIFFEYCNISNISYLDKNVIFVDAQKIHFPLIIRKWKEGDEFQPIGLKGSKKVSKFFKDEKLSLKEKEETWILECDNTIVWIVGMRMDERFKLEINSTQILKIEFKP